MNLTTFYSNRKSFSQFITKTILIKNDHVVVCTRQQWDK